MVAVRIYWFQKENLEIPPHLKTIVPSELREAFECAKLTAGRTLKVLDYLELRYANRFQAMCPSSSPNYHKHHLSVLRLFSWHHDYHWRNPTLGPTEKLDPNLLGFYIEQTAYQDYVTIFTKYLLWFRSEPYLAWYKAKRVVEETAAKSKLSDMDRRMWNHFWHVSFLGEMYKWECRIKTLDVPSWDEVVDELYGAILDCVDGAEMLANKSSGVGEEKLTLV
ncbi:hypothetical protein BDV29DRAFT_152159 [Aspergillus leporis]|jgi:hypothetical protein|uniref:Uncharacterized protein n=1 Tax=Aspergillus leporis TaxID=41062 RepID=A0A5N5XFY2_9EURO|nr:hypothetical protein BDV29DRAFT_152159 [Aspergillus leporis]